MSKVTLKVEIEEEAYKAFTEQDILICGMRSGKTLLSEVWKALKNATPITESDDVVSRQAVIEQTQNWSKDEFLRYTNPFDYLRKRINALPPIIPKREQGEWIMPVQDDGMSDHIYYQVRCSKCGFDLDPQTWHMELHQYGADKYCPNCGAEMR